MDWLNKAEQWLDNALEGLAGDTSEVRERLSLTVDGLPLDAYALELEEGLSQSPSYRVHCAVALMSDDAHALLGKAAQLTLTSRDGLSRDVAGQVDAIHQPRRLPDGRQEWVFEICSGLASLTWHRRYRIVHRRTVVELAEELLTEHGLQVERRLNEHYPVRDWTAQVGETDLDFLQRLLSQAGIWYVSETNDQGEVIVLADSQEGARRAPRALLSVHPETGGVRSQAGEESVVLDRLHGYYRRQPAQANVHQQHYPSAARPRVESSGERGQANQTLYRGGSSDDRTSQQQARLLREQWQTRQHHIEVSGPVADLQPGQWIPIEGHGPFLVVRAQASLSLPREQQGNTPQPLRWKAELIPLAQPFRPPVPPRPDMPLVFPAKVEASEPYAQLDGYGRRKARLAFDPSDVVTAEASPPLRQLQPFGGPPGRDGQPSGWDWPLRHGAEVLMTCLGEDPDQPLILGYAPTANQAGPVTGQNRHQHRLLTPAGHHLNLDDKKQAQAITLHTPNGRCLVTLDATSEAPLARVACEQGALVLRAGKQQRVQVGKEARTTIGNSQSTQVGHDAQYTTDSGAQHYQAATDVVCRAADSLRVESGTDTQISAGENVVLRAERHLSLKAGQNLAGSVEGDTHLQADNAINIQGDGSGDITIHQGGGGITVKANGSVRIFGNNVSINNKG